MASLDAKISPATDPNLAAFFDREAQTWDERYEARTYTERRELVARVVRRELGKCNRPLQEINILDFGCGSGVLVREMRKLGATITGVDSSKPMIDAAQSSLLQRDDGVHLEWVGNGSASAAYARSQYDIILCISVLEFVSDFRSAVSHLCALLRPGGVLIISVPNRKSILRWCELKIHSHPRLFARFSVFRQLTSPRCYLNLQKRQFAHAELSQALHARGMVEEEHRFCVAPTVL